MKQNWSGDYFAFPYIDDGLRGPPPVKVDSIPFDWPGTELWMGSSRGEYETCGRGATTSGASRPSSRGSADKGGEFAVSLAGDRLRYNGSPVTDELSEPVVVTSGSLLQGSGTDRLAGCGCRRSGGKTVAGRWMLLRVGLASEAAAVIREASIAEVRIDRRRAAAMSRSRGDCCLDISSSGGTPTTVGIPSAECRLVSVELPSTATGPLLLLHSVSVYQINSKHT